MLLMCTVMNSSDATDPFSRVPLTMDQVIPNVELKKKIEEWRNNLSSNN